MVSRIGQTVSHYQILQKLGEGGMGVVYKAEDLKLSRTVALKFLPESLAVHEPDRARFLQEARAAAILNHPNICTIHDVAEAGEQPFIVMECVEGKRLREILPVKKLQEAVGYAIQIAEALQAAHEKGIVHRDIKTENIMITPKNQVKVMDFGLAKMKGSLKLTKTSGPIGTVTHMSPEHILGGEVDGRSDIFSFGIVLYEMFTGHLPFRGEHEAALVYSIVNEEPEPLQHHIPDAPSELLHIINRALEKDREDRYQTVHEMLIDLRRLKKDSSKLSPLPVQHETRIPATTAATPGTQEKKASRKRLWWGVAGLIVLCIIAGLLLKPLTRSARINPNRTTLTLQVPFTFIMISALSADGKWVVFPAEDENGRWDVYLTNVAGGKPRRVTDEAAYKIESADISPDLSQIVYDCMDSPNALWKTKIISSQGGGSRTLADTGALPLWQHNGKRIGYMRRWPMMGLPKYEFMSIQADGNDSRLEFIDSMTTSGYGSFSWSPDGGSIAWVRHSEGGYGEVMIRELASGKERQLTHDRQMLGQLTWAANDEILFASNKSGQTHLWMIPASGGEQTQIVQGGLPVMNARCSADTRILMYTELEAAFHIMFTDVAGRNSRDIISRYGTMTYGAVSPDGNHIAHVIENLDLRNQDAHLYVVDRDGKNQRQLTTGSQRVGWCGWSPGGTWLAYYSVTQGEHGDSGGVYAIQPFNPGRPRLLSRERGFWWVSDERFVTHVSGKTLLYSTNGGIVTQVYQDSMVAFPVEGNRQLVFFDQRKGKEGWWVTALDSVGRQEGQARKILGNTGVILSNDIRFLVTKRGDDWWRVWSSTGKEERVGQMITGEASYLASTPNGKEILWITDEYRSRIVLVKDAFE